MIPSIAGSIVGCVAAFALAGTLRALLYGVAPTDGWSFAAAAAMQIGVALSAALIAAMRATRLSPVDALRRE